jgi:serine/threonine protein kinase
MLKGLPLPVPRSAVVTPNHPTSSAPLPGNGDAASSANERASPPAALHIGAYEVLEELGRGGMGIVYRARHRTLGHEVALKMILAGRHADDAETARFRLEAAALARLDHAHIVHIRDFGEHEGCPYFALDCLTGGSLARRLKEKGGSLPAREGAALVEKLARAVQQAHEKGFVHRDLKPGNVLFTVEGEPKVTDFGLAKDLEADDALSRTGHLLGTPAYMAPEQAAGKVRAVSAATDVWALGVLLYECLTGRVPFRGATSHETLALVLHDEPTPPRRLVSSLPRDLETICLRCLEKEPGKRYQSAADLADDLGPSCAGSR